MSATARKTTKKPTGLKPVLVTGASGCVGSLLVEELLGAGFAVRATDRPQAQSPEPRNGLTWVDADLTHYHRFPELVRGVEAVIHTAAWVDIAAPFERQAGINLHAVRHLYEAAAEEGASRFVHFSTGSIYASKDGPLDEDDPLRPTSAYELAKLLAEDFLKSRIGRGPAVTILRPALIYGPRGKVLLAAAATFPPLFRPFSGWIPGIEGGPRSNMVHALDVARAAVHVLLNPQPDGATFNVAADEVLAAGQLADVVLKVAGMETLEVRIPFPSALVAAVLPLLGYPTPFALINRVGAALWHRIVEQEGLKPELAPRVDMEAMTYMTGDVVFDNSRLKRTGFAFRYPTFIEGWRDTICWYRQNRWLPPLAAAPDTDGEKPEQGSLRICDEHTADGRAA